MGEAGVADSIRLMENNERVMLEEKYDNFLELVDDLKDETPGTIIFDVDFVIRNPVESLKKFRFGEIPESSLESLKKIKETGWKILFVTNQPKEGHQIAKIQSERLGYKAFPWALTEIFGDDAVIGGGADFLPKLTKSRAETEDKTVSWIMENGAGRFAMVSDQIRDLDFFQRVTRKIMVSSKGENDNEKAIFYKIPGPPIG